MRVFGAALALMGLSSCPYDAAPPVLSAPPPPAVESSATRELELEVWGCHSWSPDGACEVATSTSLRLVTPRFAGPVVVSGSALGSVVRTEVIEGVWAAPVGVRGAGALEARAGHRVARVVVERLSRDAPRAVLAGLLADQTRNEDTARLAADLAARGSPVERAYAASAEARLAYRSRAFEDAVRRLEASAVELERLGRGVDAARDRATRGYILGWELMRLDESQRALAAARATVGRSPDVSLVIDLYAAWNHKYAGDLRGALAAFHALAARTVGARPADRALVAQGRANTLMLLGRLADARALLLDAVGWPDLAVCTRAYLGTSLGWAGWLEAEMHQDVRLLGDAAHRLEAALVDARACPGAGARVQAATNLAYVAAMSGDLERARRALQEARGAEPSNGKRTKWWWEDIEARIELGDGRPREALAIYRRVAKRAALAHDTVAELVGAVGSARALSLAGRPREALEAGERAHQLSEWELRRAPFGDGKQSATIRYAGPSNEHLERLVAAGDVAAALRVARDIQARPLREIAVASALARTDPEIQSAVLAYRRLQRAADKEREDDWARSVNELTALAAERRERQLELDRALERLLAEASTTEPAACKPPPPGPGELLLVRHPAVETDRLFALDARGPVVATQVGTGTTTAARDLGALAPIDAALARAARVRIVEPPPAGAALGEWTWRGRALADQLPVSYGLDVCARPPRDTPVRPLTLIVDPSSNLPAAHEQIDHVTRGASSSVVLHRQQARARAVTEALERADLELFHFVGHADHAGIDGWGASFELSDGDRLRVPDVLALARVPPRVVLTACKSGATEGAGTARVLGVGQAFVLVGADEVLATSQEVYDRHAAALMERLYARLRQGDDLATALQRARDELAKSHPGAFTAYRVLVP